jgi:biotin operon repressor
MKLLARSSWRAEFQSTSCPTYGRLCGRQIRSPRASTANDCRRGASQEVELASKVGVSRTAVIKAVDQLEERGLVLTRVETELPEQLKRPQQRRIALTDSGRERAAAIQAELDDEPSPFDELWSAIRVSRSAVTAMDSVRRQAITRSRLR